MRILFLLKQMGYMRHFDGVVRALADRGHTLRIASQDGVLELPEGLQALPRVSSLRAGKKRADAWKHHVSLTRRGRDYLRYLLPEYATATKLRARAFDKLVHTLSDDQRDASPGWSDLALGLSDTEREALTAALAAIEKEIPPDAGLTDFLAQEAPDIVLITPLVDLGSGQSDYVKSAQSLGIPVGMLLFSWDNLSTKGGLHVPPDALFVWNELQKREATSLHGYPAKRVHVTGAPRFDEFFAMEPSATAAQLCELLGLDPTLPLITYLGSSKFVTRDERDFVDRWLDAARSSDGPLARSNVIIKAHPDLNRAWSEDEEERIDWFSGGRARVSRPYDDDNVVVVRSQFTAPQILYDCLTHSVAAVGLNTSAELEAGILGIPVLTILASDEIADGQQSTLHFHYLLEDHGGFVKTARNLEQHVEQLEDELRGSGERRNRIHDFIREFLRPAGADQEAAPVLATAIEEALRPKVEGRLKRQDDRTKGPRALGETESGKMLLDYPRASVWLRVSSDPERRWRVRSYKKEPFTVEWIEQFVRPGDVLFDVGANVGAFSLIAAKLCEHDLTVLAFEPGYANFARLCENIIINGCDACITPLPLPLSGSTAIHGFGYRTLEPGQSRHRIAKGTPKQKTNRQPTRYRQPMLAMRLDDMMATFALPAPTHMKLDVDGHEVEVLRGATSTLARDELRSVLVEVDPSLGEPVRTLLSEAGLKLGRRHERSAKPNAPAYELWLRE